MAEEKTRKEVLKEAFLKHIKETQPKIMMKFNMARIIDYRYGVMKGTFKNTYKEPLVPSDTYLIREIVQELRADGEILPLNPVYWTRLK